MSTDASPSDPDQRPASDDAPAPMPLPPPRLRRPVRDRVELIERDLDSLVPTDHPVRDVWRFVQTMDLAPLLERIKSREGHAGNPATDPAILVALWLWATIDGVGSARRLARLCREHDLYRWICGGVGTNHHTLSDFRTAHPDWLDAQLVRSVAVLLEAGLIDLDVVSQDGMRVRAKAKASSFRRGASLETHLIGAEIRVRELRAEMHSSDGGAAEARRRAARRRAAAERLERVEAALIELRRLEDERPVPAPDDGDDDPGAGGDGGSADSDAGKRTQGANKKRHGRSAQLRVSTTDPEARRMKMGDGGFRPAFNVQLAVETTTQLIVAVDVLGAGTDAALMRPMYERVCADYERTPETWLVDGGFVNLSGIDALGVNGTRVIAPRPASRKAGTDPGARKRKDTDAVAVWRADMGGDEAKGLYRLRGATVECANAQARRRGLIQFASYGLIKARCEVMWQALAQNLMRSRALGFGEAVMPMG